MAQPIIAFIEGIDKAPRLLSEDEVAGLTDWFGQWLAKTPVSDRQVTLRSFLNGALRVNCWKPYGIADGTPIIYDHGNPDKPLNSVSRHMRFIIIALPDVGTNLDQAILKRTLCVVASSNPDGDGKNDNAFLQCASWDPNARGTGLGMMRFYQRNSDGWMYFGDSFNAFNAASVGKGVFDGHIGGAMIMKELTQPWIHWFNSTNVDDFVDSLGSTKNQPSKCDPHNVLFDALFTENDGSAFSRLGRAEDLELIVELSVSKWYNTRFSHDFLDSNNKPLPQISTVIGNWIGHILCSRSMNMVASATSSAQVNQAEDILGVPPTLFFNLKALQRLLPDVGPQTNYSIQNEVYVNAVSSLGLSLFYDDFSTDPPTRTVAVADSEGPFAFPIIEPGVEDYEGVVTLMKKSSTATLLPPKAIAAMLMVDFYNPIYSARRESLMQYVPKAAELKADGKTYDVLDQLMSKLSASSASKDTKSPEFELLQLLNTPDASYVDIFTTRVNSYLQKVSDRLSNPRTRSAGVEDYMTVAEGRRRMYKGREDEKPDGSGLDEFALTLPFAAKLPPSLLTRMKEDGEVEVMPPLEVSHFSAMNQQKKANALVRFANSSGGCTAYRKRAAAGACPIFS